MLSWEGLDKQVAESMAALGLNGALFGVTEEEAKNNWIKVLSVHHINENHYDNDPSNLITVCPNVHGMITMHGKHYLNRYTELRNKLLDKAAQS